MFEIVCKKVFVWDWRYLVEGFRRPAALSQSYKRPVGVLLRRILGSSPNQCVNSQPSPSGHHLQPPLVLGYPGEAVRPRLEHLPRRLVVSLPRVFWSSVILTGNQTMCWFTQASLERGGLWSKKRKYTEPSGASLVTDCITTLSSPQPSN